MAFKITKDYLTDGTAKPGTNDNAVGIYYPSSRKRDFSDCIHAFRMLDDDRKVYYEGFSNDNSSEKAFDPIDCFGEPNAGCTIIQYKNDKGQWTDL